MAGAANRPKMSFATSKSGNFPRATGDHGLGEAEKLQESAHVSHRLLKIPLFYSLFSICFL